MEEKKQQEQPLKKDKSDKMKTVNMASHVAGAVGIGAASYAYGAHRASGNESGNNGHDGGDKEVENEWVEQETQAVETQIKENENGDGSDKEFVFEAEPIAHIDGIDIDTVTLIEETEQIAGIIPEDEIVTIGEIYVDPIYPEPELPETNLIASNEIDVTDLIIGTDVASSEIPDDSIGNDIQQDLFISIREEQP